MREYMDNVRGDFAERIQTLVAAKDKYQEATSDLKATTA